MVNKVIINNVPGVSVKPMSEFEDFQGDLKDINKSRLDKLKKNILRLGFASPIFIWAGHDYILDGHQRIKALKELLKEGYEYANVTTDGQVIKDTQYLLPYVNIRAKTQKEAAELILSYNSQYGRIQQAGLIDFGEKYSLDLPELSERVELEVDLPKVKKEDIDLNKTNDPEEVDHLGKHVITCPNCNHSFKTK